MTAADRPAEPTPTHMPVICCRAHALAGEPTPTGADRPTTDRCEFRAGWCQKEAGHDGPHFTEYRDGELWTPAEARQQPQPLDVDVLAEALRVELGPEIVWRPIISDDPWRHYAERLRRECRNVVAEIRPAVDALERLVNSWGGAGFINNRGRYEQAERAFRDGVDALNALSQSGVLDEVAGLSDD